MTVVFNQAVRVQANPRLVLRLRLEVREYVHACGIEPDKEGLVGLVCTLDEILGRGQDLLINRFHALGRQWTGIFAFLLAPGTKTFVLSGILGCGRFAFKHPSRRNLVSHSARGVIGQLGFFLDIQVVEVAKELVKTVHRGHELIAVTQVVLAELPGHIAEGLDEISNGWIFLLQTLRSTGHADLGETGAHRNLASDERRPPRGTTLLTVIVGEGQSLAGDTVNVGRLVAHHAVINMAQVPVANIVTHHEQDVGFFAGCDCVARHHEHQTDSKGINKPYEFL